MIDSGLILIQSHLPKMTQVPRIMNGNEMCVALFVIGEWAKHCSPFKLRGFDNNFFTAKMDRDKTSEDSHLQVFPAVRPQSFC
jgi:hypothetical protein